MINPLFVPTENYEEEVNLLDKPKTNKIALIDADRYKHVVTYRMWKKIVDEGVLHSKKLVDSVIQDYLDRDIFNCFEAKSYVFCFSAPTGKVFRSYIAKSKLYKGNRKNKQDNHFYPEKYDDMNYIYDYFNKRYVTLLHDDIEADDLLSLLQNDNTFLFTHDGDLKQVPGTHWDLKENCFYEINKEDAFKELMFQILKGAGKDNIPGLKGFGESALSNFKKTIQSQKMSSEAVMFSTQKFFINKYGTIKGIDLFNEQYMLCSTLKPYGDWLKEKYNSSFYTIQQFAKILLDDDNKENAKLKAIT